MRTIEKILDKKRSIGSKAHSIFGSLMCDECGECSDILYQFRLENMEASEDSYCSSCFNHIVLLSQDQEKHFWDCKCILCR